MGALALFRPARSAARQALHEAISAHADAEAASIAAKAAVGRGMRHQDESEERLTQAAEAVAAAKAAQATRLTSAAATAGALLATDCGLRDARARHSDCEDAASAARGAVGELQRQALAAERRIVDAQAGIARAARGVLVERIEPTLSRAVAIRGEIDAVSLELNAALQVELAALKFLNDVCCSRKLPASELPEAVWQPLSSVLAKERLNFDPKVTEAWREAWEALMGGDVDAPLPS